MCFAKFQETWNASDSVTHAFATFIMLSSFNLTYDVMTLFLYTDVRDINGTVVRKALLYDSSVVMYSTEHMLYLATAVMLFLILSMIPALLLCLYPTRAYEKVSRYCSARKRLTVKIFSEALHSCFKNGLNGTRDYRASAGLIVMAPFSSALVNYTFAQFLQPTCLPILHDILFIIFSFSLSYLRPCKSLIIVSH